MDYIKNRRMLSLLGQRGTFGTVLHDLAKDDNRIYALSADLTRTSGLERFAQDYKDRFLNAGIAEQNAIGVAAGLADQGYVPFVTTFANFAALRANEFVRHFMAYMNCNVKLVGLSSGFAMELFGNTHYGVEDISVLRSMPNLTILSPADCVELAKCVEYCVSVNGPVYLRLSGKMNNPIVYKEDYVFEVGKGIVLKEGFDVLLYATGSMVNVALKSAEMLEQVGVSTSVINIHTIKPLDEKIILDNKDYRLIVTIEEHSTIGGLGSAVAEELTKYSSHGKLVRMGTRNQYERAGDYEYMLKRHNLTSEDIVETVKANIE